MKKTPPRSLIFFSGEHVAKIFVGPAARVRQKSEMHAAKRIPTITPSLQRIAVLPSFSAPFISFYRSMKQSTQAERDKLIRELQNIATTSLSSTWAHQCVTQSSTRFFLERSGLHYHRPRLETISFRLPKTFQHGDLTDSNMLIHPKTKTPQLIDWELSKDGSLILDIADYYYRKECPQNSTDRTDHEHWIENNQSQTQTLAKRIGCCPKQLRIFALADRNERTALKYRRILESPLGFLTPDVKRKSRICMERHAAIINAIKNISRRKELRHND